MRLQQHIARTTAAWSFLLAFMVLFRPQSLPVVGLIIPFVLLFGALYASWNLFGALRARYVGASGRLPSRKHLGVAVCMCVVLLVVLQSLGQLTLRDVFTLAAIVTLGYMYLARSRFSASGR